MLLVCLLGLYLTGFYSLCFEHNENTDLIRNRASLHHHKCCHSDRTITFDNQFHNTSDTTTIEVKTQHMESMESRYHVISRLSCQCIVVPD